MHGLEVWNWKEYEELEREQEKYLTYLLGLHRETHGYIVRKKLER